MLKHWAAWPRGVRWLTVGIAIALALAIVWALFVPVADWLARHDVGSAKGSLLQTARDAARGRLLTLGAGLVAAGALLFTARSFMLSREGQVTDRYTKAIEQLGSKELDVRIGGIYALERIARDSAKDHPAVMEVLTTFIREHSREQWPSPGPDGAEPERSTRPDVQAALTVVGRRDERQDSRFWHINLRGVLLPEANIAEADLTSADLTGATLVHVFLVRATLTEATLTEADLTGADLTGAKLTGADLAKAVLAGADLTRATLRGAALRGADLTGAKLTGADLHWAVLAGADLRHAHLGGADLTIADLTGADLAGAVLTGAKWHRDVPTPEGWKLDTAGWLERGTGAGPTEAS
jgi:Pentapeptide repeats (8 copies)